MAVRPRNGLSLCAGAGGLDMGLMLAEPGFHTRCWVEWEEYPRSAIIAGQRAGYFAPAPIWDDVTTFDGRPFAGAIDTVLAGYPCFVAGTIICTKRGHIPIEEVAIGDLVLTHRGRWRPVTARMGKSGAPVRQIKAQGVPGVVCTDEHPFYVRGGNWIAAQHIARGDSLGQVLPPVVDDEQSGEFWWVIGRYLADGWRQWSPSQRGRRRGRISICCARHEADDLERRIEAAGLVAYRSEERATTRFAITRHDLYEFCGQFGEGAAGKHLPGWVLGLDSDRARALCEGYFSGDGYRYRNPRGEGGGWRVTTVSRGLALSFAALAQRAFGVVASIRRYSGDERTSIEGRDVAQRDQYFLVVPDRNRSGRVAGDYAWKLVRSNEPCGIADVFNIAVEEDESYVADGAIVHNCQPFSHAGQRRGEDDERHLWPDVARIIREISPEWVFLENVAGHVSLGLEAVLRELRDMGFAPAAGLFSAAETGAPHERLRVFIVAHSDRDQRRADSGEPHTRADGRDDIGRRGVQVAHLANTDGGNAGPERQQRSGEQRLLAARDGTGDEPLGNAPSLGRREGRPEPEFRSGRSAASRAGGAMANTSKPGLSGRERPGSPDERNRSPSHGPTPECGRPWLFPPGPADTGGWSHIIADAPHLAPSASLGDVKRAADHFAALVVQGDMEEAQAESILRGMVAGLSHRSRSLRLLGNAVVPLQAAYAWRELSKAHGLVWPPGEQS